MKVLATLSVLLAAALMLFPWAICDCGADGPHLKSVWDHEACDTTDGPRPADGAPGPDERCDLGYTFEGSVCASAPTLAVPAAADLLFPATLGSAEPGMPATVVDGHALLLPSPGPAPSSPLQQATRLLI